MSIRDVKRKEPGKRILLLFVFFIALVLRDAATGALSSTWVTVMGGIIIVLALSAILIRYKA